MENKKKDAIKLFKSGFNCAQVVFNAFSDELDIDKNTALTISSGFGGSMARQQKSCGAVTSAYMVIGILAGRNITDNTERKEKAYEIIWKFNELFISENGSTNCKELLNCNISSKEGLDYAEKNKLFEKVCEKMCCRFN